MFEALKMLEMFAHVSSQDELNDVTSQCPVRLPVSAAANNSDRIIAEFMRGP